MATAETDQLIELLIQLQKTTPDQARAILNAQPQIAYALMPLMVKMNLVNVDVLQSQLAAYAASSAPPAQQPPQPVPSVPAHVMQAQPPAAVPPQPPTYPPAQTYPTSPAVPPVYQAPQGVYGAPPGANGQAGFGGRPGYAQQMAPPPQPQQQPVQQSVALPDALAGMPEEQRNMIMRVVQMTPDQVARLPPNERQSVMQLVYQWNDEHAIWFAGKANTAAETFQTLQPLNKYT